MLRLKSGDRLTGSMTLKEHGTVVLDSAQLGAIKINMSNVAQISSSSTILYSSTESILSALAIQAKGTETVAQKTDSQSALKSEEPLGEDSKQDLGPAFLRQATVLLAPGEFQVEFALSYLRDQFLNQRTRQASFISALRFGLPYRMEGFVNVPVSWRYNEFFDVTGTFKDDQAGLGDVAGGLNIVLYEEDVNWPEVILQLGFGAPTGDDPSLLNPREVSLGLGRWRGSAGLNLVRSFDPAVVFGGIGFEYLTDETFDGIGIQGGHRLTYDFGTGFAVNSQLTLSGRFIGAYQTKTKLDGTKIEGSDIEPMSLRFSSTYRFSKKQYLEPSVRFGLNDDAIDTIINLSYFFNF
jgi:hypothetical protein